MLPKLKKRDVEKFTLVLDLDETLVYAGVTPMKIYDQKVKFSFSNSTFNLYVKHRPFLIEFL